MNETLRNNGMKPDDKNLKTPNPQIRGKPNYLNQTN